MSRDGSGTMSVINTFSPGDTIASSTTNANNNDFADELTNSVAVDGQSTMTGQLKLENGTAAAPAVTFGSDTDNGIFRKSANTIGIAAGGSEIGTIDANGFGGSLFVMPMGQGQLIYNSTTEIQLNRYKGRFLFINGVNYAIPSTGPTLSNGSLSASTLYYIYAYMNSGTMTLEASATGYATDSTYGHEIKSGDSTRSLVGMAYADGSSQFVAQLVISWYCKRLRSFQTTYSSDRTASSTSMAELNTEIAAKTLTWANEPPSFELSATATASATCVGAAQLYVDNTTVIAQVGQNISASSIGNLSLAKDTLASEFSEGYHYTTVRANVSTGNLTFSSSDGTYAGKTRLSVRFMG